MRTTYLSKILDFVFGNLLVFLIAYVWTRFFWTDQRINFLISFFVMILVCLLYNYFSEKKAKKTKTNKEQIQNANNISTSFLLSAKQDVLKTFAKNLNKKYQAKLEKSMIFVNGNILLPIFEVQEITDKEVLNAYLKTKSLTCKKLILVGHKISQSATDIANLITDKKIVLLDAMSAYKSIYQPLGFDVPKVQITAKKTKNVKQYLNTAFSKKNTKNYFMVSAYLLFGSFVLRYNIYYLIFASITTIFALYSHFNKKFNAEQNEKLIDGI